MSPRATKIRLRPAPDDVRRGLLIGVDEVGRGTWAGPVTACAFAFLEPKDAESRGIRKRLDDSKALSPARRKELSDELHEMATRGAVAFAFGEASCGEVDEHNVRQATRLAMGRALEGLLGPVAAAYLGGVGADGARIVIDGKDGFSFLGMPRPQYLVRGDSQVPEIMAASVLAKVHRDALMEKMDAQLPGYAFSRHKGYGTALHAGALAKLGPCEQHRKTFAPVAAVMKNKARKAAKAKKKV